MATISSTPENSDIIPLSLADLYFIWTDERDILGLLPCLNSENVWEYFSSSSHTVSRRALNLPDFIKPSDNLHKDEDEGSVDTMDSPVDTMNSPDAAPEGQIPITSTCGTWQNRCEPSIGPFTANLIHASGPPSPLRDLFPQSPNGGLQNFYPTLTPLPAPVPVHPLSWARISEDSDFLRGEEAYNLLSSPEQTIDCWDPYPWMTSLTAPPLATIWDTGHDDMGPVNSWYAHGAVDQNLPVPQDGSWFLPSAIDHAAPDQPLPNNIPDRFGYTNLPHSMPTPHTFYAPPPLPAPVPATTGRSHDSVEDQWKGIAQVLESDRPQAVAPPLPNEQDDLLAHVQQTLAALGQNGDDAASVLRRLLRVERVVMSFVPLES